MSEPADGGDGTEKADGAGGARSLLPLAFEESVGAIAMAAIALISIGNVIVRYATNVSFAFTEEFSIVLLVVMTFAGAALAHARDANIRIVYFRNLMPRPVAFLFDVVVVVASFAMFALVLWYGARLAYDQWDFGETSPGLGYPTWIYTVFMLLLAGLVLYRIAGRALVDLLRRRGRPPGDPRAGGA